MANSQAVSHSFKSEILNGVHALGNGSVTRSAGVVDALKACLVLATGSVGATQTNAGTPGSGTPSVTNIGTNEVSGSGYTAGGVVVTNATAPANDGANGAYWTPSAPIVYSSVTLTTNFDAVHIYNTTQGNKSVATYTFTAQTITAGTLTLTMPTNNATLGLLRII